VAILRVANPFTTSLSVPSPPQAITSSRPSRVAFWAISVAWPGPVVFRQFRLNPVLGKKLTGLVNQAPPSVSAAPRIGVVNQQRIVKSHIHDWDTA